MCLFKGKVGVGTQPRYHADIVQAHYSGLYDFDSQTTDSLSKGEKTKPEKEDGRGGWGAVSLFHNGFSQGQ